VSKGEGGEDFYTTQSDRHPDLLATQEEGGSKMREKLTVH